MLAECIQRLHCQLKFLRGCVCNEVVRHECRVCGLAGGGSVEVMWECVQVVVGKSNMVSNEIARHSRVPLTPCPTKLVNAAGRASEDRGSIKANNVRETARPFAGFRGNVSVTAR